jgi:RNA polymerase sigma-B factor
MPLAASTTAQPGRVEVRPGDRQTASRVDGWFHDFQQSGDPEVRDRIICAYLGLADRLAERFRTSRGTTIEDLVQTARTGLVAAVDRYDPDRGTPFVPFAVACVVGELKRHLRDTTWRVHVARPIKERALRLARALDELDQQLGRSPTVAELAGHLGESAEAVLEAMEALRSRSEPSLDAPAQPNGDGGEQATAVGELLAAPPPAEEPEDLLLLPELLGKLPALERRVVLLRFIEELTQDQIAERIGYSQMHVSRLLRRALQRMRDELLVA